MLKAWAEEQPRGEPSPADRRGPDPRAPATSTIPASPQSMPGARRRAAGGAERPADQRLGAAGARCRRSSRANTAPAPSPCWASRPRPSARSRTCRRRCWRAATSPTPTRPASSSARTSRSKLKTRLGKRVILMAQAADGHLAEVGCPSSASSANTTPAQDEYVFTGLGAAQSDARAERPALGDRLRRRPHATLEDAVAALKRAAPALDIADLDDPLAARLHHGDSSPRRYIAHLADGDVRADGHRHRQHPADGGVRAHARVRPAAGAGHAAGPDRRPGHAGIGAADRRRRAGRRRADGADPAAVRATASTSASWPRGRRWPAAAACSIRSSTRPTRVDLRPDRLGAGRRHRRSGRRARPPGPARSSPWARL